ncbi:MAG: hypothetical protein AAF214_02970 [Pseudomonadota bacterium]
MWGFAMKDDHSTDYAVDINVTGFKVRITSERCVIWLCTTMLLSLSLVAFMLLLVRGGGGRAA